MIVSAAMSAAVVIAAVVSWFMLVSPTRIAFVNYQTVVLGQIAAGKDIATSKILAKVGPVLGLMGTLIPMGPALVGLSTGDIASMAHNMQVAFVTTVVGLVVSTIGFLTQQKKERWAVMDMTILGHVAELLD